MSAGRHDLNIDQGETFERQFLYLDSDGDIVDLTGYAGARMHIRDGRDWSLVLDTSLPVGGGVVLGGAAGSVTVTIPALTTAHLPVGRVLSYDLCVIAPSGAVTYLSDGAVRVRRQASLDGTDGGSAHDNGLYVIDGGDSNG